MRDRLVPGQGQIPARVINALGDGVSRLLRRRGGNGVVIASGSGSESFRAVDDRFMGQLSGSANPYGITEVYDTPGGGYATLGGGRSCTSCTYVDNNPSGLNGKFVEVRPGPIDGEYRATYKRWNHAPPCTLKVKCLRCCGLPAPGATVTLTQGGTTIGTCTTGSDGTCTISYSGNGTYTVSGTLTGCGTASQTFTASPCVSSVTLTLCDWPRSTRNCSLTINCPQYCCGTDPGGSGFVNPFSNSPCTASLVLGGMACNCFWNTPCCPTQNVNTTLNYLGVLPCYDIHGNPTGVSVPTWRSPVLTGVTIPVAICQPGNVVTACMPVCAINLTCGCGPQLTLILGDFSLYPCSSIDNTKTSYSVYSFQAASGSTCNPLMLNYQHHADSIQCYGGSSTFFLDNSTAVIT